MKIVSEELTELMGGAGRDLVFAKGGPTVILDGRPPGLGQDDRLRQARPPPARGEGARRGGRRLRPPAPRRGRPAGQGRRAQAGATVYEQGTSRDPVDVAEWALGQAKAERRDVLIVDTAGRLHVDAELMDQLAQIKKRTKPHDVLLVVDAMTGQDAVNVAEAFAEATDFDGVILSKLDGDARGGAALSVKAITGKPILYASTGEKLDAFERFHPDRMAQRILGMGDVMTLIEKAEQRIDEDQAPELERKIRKNQFTLDDFLDQLKQVRSMGPLQNLLKMIPGVGQQLGALKVDDKELDRLQAIITSMTPGRAREPEDDRRVAPAADRRGVGHQRPGGLPPGQAVRPDAEDDAPAAEGQDAQPAAAGRRAVAPGRGNPIANLRALYGRQGQAHPSGQQEEPDLARRRR